VGGRDEAAGNADAAKDGRVLILQAEIHGIRILRACLSIVGRLSSSVRQLIFSEIAVKCFPVQKALR